MFIVFEVYKIFYPNILRKQKSESIMTEEISILESQDVIADHQRSQDHCPADARPSVQPVSSSTAVSKVKNDRKRKSEDTRRTLNGVISKLNECFNEMNSVWANNPRNTNLSLISGEILKVRELVSDELDKLNEPEG